MGVEDSPELEVEMLRACRLGSLIDCVETVRWRKAVGLRVEGETGERRSLGSDTSDGSNESDPSGQVKWRITVFVAHCDQGSISNRS